MKGLPSKHHPEALWLFDMSDRDWEFLHDRCIYAWQVHRDDCCVHWTSYYLLGQYKGFEFATPAAKKWMRKLVRIADINRKYKLEPPPDAYEWHLMFHEDTELRPYQISGMERMWESTHIMNNDDVGLGKTIQSLGVAARSSEEEHVTTLVITTASCKFQWRDEIAKFTPQLMSVVVDGSAAQRKSQWQTVADIYVAGWSNVRIKSDWESMLDLVPMNIIMDEPSMVGNYGNKTHAQAIQLAKHASRLMLLNATPIDRGLENVYSYMRFIDAKVFGPYSLFRRRHVRYEEEPDWVSRKRRKGKAVRWFPKVEAYIRLKEARFRVAAYSVRRTAAEVDLQIPDYTTIPVYATMSKAEDQAYKREVRNALNSRKTTAAAIGDIRLAAASCKCERLIELLERIDESALVFTGYTRVISRIASELRKRGIQPYIIDGSVSGVQRRKIVESFSMKDNKRKVLLASEAASKGLNLQAAKLVVNFDLPWLHSHLRQRIGRSHRLGQKSKIRVANFIAVRANGKPTLDHWLAGLVQNRRDIHTEVFGDDAIDEIGIDKMDKVTFRKILRQFI